jgi:hypothetical protein
LIIILLLHLIIGIELLLLILLIRLLINYCHRSAKILCRITLSWIGLKIWIRVCRLLRWKSNLSILSRNLWSSWNWIWNLSIVIVSMILLSLQLGLSSLYYTSTHLRILYLLLLLIWLLLVVPLWLVKLLLGNLRWSMVAWSLRHLNLLISYYKFYYSSNVVCQILN